MSSTKDSEVCVSGCDDDMTWEVAGVNYAVIHPCVESEIRQMLIRDGYIVVVSDNPVAK